MKNTPSKKYLFIVCPNQSGSTLLYRWLATSSRVKKLSTEGQLIDGFAGPINERGDYSGTIFSEYKEAFSSNINYDWTKIKVKWHKNWEKGLKDENILLEKSPPNVMRAHLLEKQFTPSYFILSIRNPYAICEGMKRHISYPVKKSAIHWGECAKRQIWNINHLDKRNLCWFTYEEFCDTPNAIKGYLCKVLPELEDINMDALIPCHSIDDMAGIRRKKIQNYNDEQIKQLDKSEISAITKELTAYKEEMGFFRYEYM